MIAELEQLTWGRQVNHHALHGLRHLVTNTALESQTIPTGSRYSKKWGSGLEFDQLREYSYGDDPRFIDWKASSRLNTLYSKQFIEDKDANCLIVIDLQDSMYFGSRKRLLSTLACYSAALLAWKWQTHGYAVAFSVISSRQVSEFRATHKEAQIKRQLYSIARLHNTNQARHHKSVLASHCHVKLWRRFERVAVFTHVLAVSDDLLRKMIHKQKRNSRTLVAMSDPLLVHIPSTGWLSDGYITRNNRELLNHNEREQLIDEVFRKAKNYAIAVANLDTGSSIGDIAARINGI